MRKFHFTVEQQNSIIAEYQSGSSCRLISTKYACSTALIWQLLKHHGIKTRPNQTIKEDMTGQIFGKLTVSHYVGKSRWQCLCSCGNTFTASRTNLLQRKSTHCGCSRRFGGTQFYKADRAKEIVAMYQSGKTGEEIGEFFGVDKSVVYLALKHENVQRRSLSEAKRSLKVNENALSELNPEVEYWLGMIITDGCVFSYKHGDYQDKLRFALQEKDLAHVEKFRDFFQSEAKISYSKKTRSYAISICCKQIVSDLLKWDITPRKSVIATVHPNLCDSIHFWRGCVDGDGCLTYRNPSRHVKNRQPKLGICGSDDLVVKFCDFVKRRLGFEPPTFRRHYRILTATYSCHKAVAIANLLYDTSGPSLDRKAAIAREFKSYTTQSVTDWSKITRQMILDSFARLKCWKAVAKELQICHRTLSVYRSSQYHITRAEWSALR